MSMCVSRFVHLHSCLWRPEVNAGCLLQCPLHCSLETGLLTGLELTTQSGLSSQEAPGIAVFVSQCWDYGWVLLYSASYTGTGTNSGPHACVAMLFTNGAILLAQSWVRL